MKRMREFRGTVDRLAAMHERLGSRRSAQALRELGEAIQDYDDQTVATFVKRATPKKSSPRPTRRR